MKPLQIFVGAMLLAAICGSAAGQSSCPAARVLANIEVGASDFSLADLLSPDTCAEILRAASTVHLGKAPLLGSARVFDGGTLRRLLLDLAANNENHETEHFGLEVPERVTVKRAGPRMSCPQLASALSEAAPTPASSGPVDIAAVHKSWAATVAAQSLDCGPTDRVPRDARLELRKISWNPALLSWEFSLRCIDAKDCVPFLVRTTGPKTSPAAFRIAPQKHTPVAPSDRAARLSIAPAAEIQPALENVEIVVRPGQPVTLVWEQAGIRMVLPVICLDRGGLGASVRARVKNSRRVLRAQVISAGVLRAAS